MRDGPDGLEVLLLRRNERAGFVPGFYVFPGGRVDPGDSVPAALARLDGLTPERAAERLGLVNADPPAVAYYVAAMREAFEETGILVGARAPSSPRDTPSGAEARATRAREGLLADRIGFAEALALMDCRVPGDALEYLAHWITPEWEPRRYDTRFFAARVAADTEADIDPREMTAALWVTPDRGVRGAEARELPMIRPTVRTLRQLAEFSSTEAVLAALPHLAVPTIQPGLDSAAEAP
jgi:8-oxo-dGTP pyrophosphatase MutT (NUDIX family)